MHACCLPLRPVVMVGRYLIIYSLFLYAEGWFISMSWSSMNHFELVCWPLSPSNLSPIHQSTVAIKSLSRIWPYYHLISVDLGWSQLLLSLGQFFFMKKDNFFQNFDFKVKILILRSTFWFLVVQDKNFQSLGQNLVTILVVWGQNLSKFKFVVVPDKISQSLGQNLVTILVV